MKPSVIIEAQGVVSVLHQTPTLQTILVHLNEDDKILRTLNYYSALGLFDVSSTDIFLSSCGFHAQPDFRLVDIWRGVGSCCPLPWENWAWLYVVAVSGCGVCSLYGKPWGRSTALGAGGCAKVKCVREGANSLVVWFLQGHIGFGALWKWEALLTAIPPRVGFSFGKNSFVFVPRMLLKHVELIQWGRWGGRGTNKVLYVITHQKENKVLSICFSMLLESCKAASEMM